MELRVGGTVQHRFKHSTLTTPADPIPDKYRELAPTDGAACDFTGHVTRCEPPRVLAYTWGSPESEVTFELTPEDTRVRLVLTHRRLGDDKAVLAGVGGGWHAHLAVLAARLAGVTPPPFWGTFTRSEAGYAVALAQIKG